MSVAVTDFREILDEFQDKVYNQAFRMLGSREEAEEATQDIFLRIHRSLEDFRGESKLSTWIYRITANACISRMRKKKLDTSSLDEPVAGEGRPVKHTIPDEDSDPEADAQRGEMAGVVREEIRRLRPEWAQAISLHYFGGLSYEEASEVMQIPRATVATYISRAKKQLSRQIIARTGTDGVYI